jgi:hypothetical protein
MRGRDPRRRAVVLPQAAPSMSYYRSLVRVLNAKEVCDSPVRVITSSTKG